MATPTIAPPGTDARETTPMTTEEFETWAEGLREAYVRCRDLGHRWRTVNVEWSQDDKLYYRHLRCPECSTMRAQAFTYDGATVANSYVYPEGYQAPPGVGRLDAGDRGTLRLVSLRRVLASQERKAS